jgi:hypothetical protein
MLKAIEKFQNKSELLQLTAQYQLLRQLKSYGLDPHDWRFQSFQWDNQRTGEASVAISHRRDDNLRLKGLVQKSNSPMRDLSLYRWSDLSWDL